MTRPVAAVIFDMDGVLVDTEPVHQAAMTAFLLPDVLTDAHYHGLVGMGTDATMQWLRDTFGRRESVAELRRGYHAAVSETLSRARLRALPGVRELIDAVHARGLPIAVASQSAPAWVRATLRACGLQRAFPLAVTADEVPRAKPAPDIYLHTAARLGVDPRRCLAIEDSIFGVRSARDAGMAVVQTRQTAFAAPPQPGAFVLQSLAGFDAGWLDTGLPGS
ncbi:MAG: HAD family phosphatase [Chloroflexi bacterium]|nr:HAD family phosphatase [Chloroflexota bacterium]MDA1003085.1 HAD family phosphatase [Chloroflexota bacterium]